MGLLRHDDHHDAGRALRDQMHERLWSVGDDYWIEDSNGRRAFKKALVGARDRFVVDVEHGDDLKVHGDILDHEYVVERHGDKIAEISKAWFRVRDTCGVEILDPDDAALVLAITVAGDALAHGLD